MRNIKQGDIVTILKIKINDRYHENLEGIFVRYGREGVQEEFDKVIVQYDIHYMTFDESNVELKDATTYTKHK